MGKMAIISRRGGPCCLGLLSALALILAKGVLAGDWDRHNEWSNPRHERGFSSNPAQDRQNSLMNGRLSFLQTPRVAPPTVQRYEAWKNAPIVQTAAVKKPDTFLAYLGRSIKQNVVEVGRAIVAAVVKPFQAIKQAVTGIVKTFNNLVSPAPLPKTQNIQVPLPAIPKSPGLTPLPQGKPKPIITPINTDKPQHNITPVDQNIPKVTFHTKGGEKYLPVETKAERWKHRVTEALFGYRRVPIERIVPNPNDDYSKPHVGPSETKLKYHRDFYNNHGRFDNSDGKPSAVITPNGYMLENGHHRYQIAQEKRHTHFDLGKVHRD